MKKETDFSEEARIAHRWCKDKGEGWIIRGVLWKGRYCTGI